MSVIKICGLTRTEDAAAAEAAGATFGGVILAPGSPRTVAADRVEEIFGETGLLRCGVFVNEEYASLLRLIDDLALNVVQLHGDEEPELAASIREETGVETWKALRPRSAAEFIAELRRYSGYVDGLLVDSWSPQARGGTGTRFPWEIVVMNRHLVPDGVRLIIAGGLTPTNVGILLHQIVPDVLDVSSGVEVRPGIKDHVLINEFVRAARAARTRESVG